MMTRRELVAGAALCAVTAGACKGSGAGDAPLDTIAPDDLARRLADSSARRPTILHIGPKYLYGKSHVPSAVHAGEAGEPAGLERLRRTASALGHDDDVIVYCGCCPSYRCPNVRPANAELRKLGFTRVRVLDLPTTLKDDWTDRGHPVEKGETTE
jgi:hypothetical protein